MAAVDAIAALPAEPRPAAACAEKTQPHAANVAFKAAPDTVPDAKQCGCADPLVLEHKGPAPASVSASVSAASAAAGGATAGGHALVARVDAHEFDWVMRTFRSFFAKKGLREAATQNTVDILSACEDTQNLGAFRFVDGHEYPLKQTGQMILEDELLREPDVPGYFCQTTSYRFEKNPKPGRHNLVFPMMEFEIHGDLDQLMRFERELLEHFGFGKAASFPSGDYTEVCKRYGVDELGHEHEERLRQDFGPVFFLYNFPETTSPFWNMKRDASRTGADGQPVARKCDVIMNGIETIGSAERSCDAKAMRESFYAIMKGEYAQALFERFGRARVERELDAFFRHKFIERSGAGIGITRMISACKAAGLIPPRPPRPAPAPAATAAKT
jgi:aspartyl/asparaginyl-tRNA synthetase